MAKLYLVKRKYTSEISLNLNTIKYDISIFYNIHMHASLVIFRIMIY